MHVSSKSVNIYVTSPDVTETAVYVEYPVCPAVAAACSAPCPLWSRWLTFAPFTSRNSQANSDPCRRHREVEPPVNFNLL